MKELVPITLTFRGSIELCQKLHHLLSFYEQEHSVMKDLSSVFELVHNYESYAGPTVRYTKHELLPDGSLRLSIDTTPGSVAFASYVHKTTGLGYLDVLPNQERLSESTELSRKLHYKCIVVDFRAPEECEGVHVKSLAVTANGIKIRGVANWTETEHFETESSSCVYSWAEQGSDCISVLHDKDMIRAVTSVDEITLQDKYGNPVEDFDLVAIRYSWYGDDVARPWELVPQSVIDAYNKKHENGTCVTLSELGPVCTLELDSYQVKLLKRLLRQFIDYDDSCKDNEDIVAEKLLRKLE